MSLFDCFRRKSLIASIPSLSLEEARKRSRLLLIDDSDEAFPLALLEEEGYTIKQWKSVKSYRELENGEYDIIILDIHGIVPEDPVNGGLAVLQHIKKYNPAQIVIAYSGKKYDIRQSAFFKLADDVLGKQSTVHECKQKIDDLLQSRFSVTHYWNALKDELLRREVGPKTIRKLEGEILGSIKSSTPVSETKIMDVLKASKEVVSISATIIGIILKLSTP